MSDPLSDLCHLYQLYHMSVLIMSPQWWYRDITGHITPARVYITAVFGWTKVSHLAPSKFRVVPEPPLIFGKFLQSSAGTTYMNIWRQRKKWCSVANWEPFQGVLATNLLKIGWFQHYYLFYHWEPLCRFWPFWAHENRCVNHNPTRLLLFYMQESHAASVLPL